jgi:protein gp37
MNKQGPNGIGWCDWTWNPIVGCSPASDGCENCYAAAVSRRFGLPWGQAHFMPERLTQPATVRKPGRVFCCSMSDIAHPTVKPAWREAIYAAMRASWWHTFIILTKRPAALAHDHTPTNMWAGVTCERQARVDERLAALYCIPAARHFVSVEPMLEPVTFRHWHSQPDWVICGPETGPGARPCDWAWIEELAAESPCFFDKRKTGWTRREFPEESPR